MNLGGDGTPGTLRTARAPCEWRKKPAR